MFRTLLALAVIIGLLFSQMTPIFQCDRTSSEVSSISIGADSTDPYSDVSNTNFPEEDEEESPDAQIDQLKFLLTQTTISMPIPAGVRLCLFSSNLKSQIIPSRVDRPPRSIT